MSTTQTFIQWSQPFSYDNGSSPSVSINENGLCLEMHNGPSGDDGMYYRLGQYSAQMNSNQTPPINWSGITYIAGGAGNQLTCGLSNQYAAMVYQDDDKNLYFQWASVPGSGNVLSWEGSTNYTSGEKPAMAMASNSKVVAVHQDSSDVSYTMWYATGAGGAGIGSAAEIIQANGDSIDGNTIKVAMNSQGNVVIMSSYEESVSLLAGTMQNNGSIDWGNSLSLDDWYDSFDIALDDNNNLIMLAVVPGADGLVSYLSWATGTVSNNTVTMNYPLPNNSLLPLYYFDLSDVSVAINNQGNLIAEVSNEDGSPTEFQYFIGQAYFNQDYSRWMGENSATIGNIPLSLLAIPGSHDSGTFAISSDSSITPDNPSTILSELAPSVATAWSQAQDIDFIGQLNAGIRYFDLRVIACSVNDGNNTSTSYYTCHGFLGAALDQLFSDIQTFYAQGEQYSNEIIMLDMNHIYTSVWDELTSSWGVPSCGVSWGGVDCWMPGGTGTEAQFPALCSYINNNIGSMLLPPSLNGASLNEIYQSQEYIQGGRILLFLDDGYSVQQNSNYWPNDDNSTSNYWNTVDGMPMPANTPNSTISSIWPDDSTLGGLITDNADSLNKPLMTAWTSWINSGSAPSQFTVLQCIGTESSSIIKAGANPFSYSPDSLQSWEATVCSPYMFYLASNSNSIAANVILVDWLEQTIVTPLCMAINQQKAAAYAAAKQNSGT